MSLLIRRKFFKKLVDQIPLKKKFINDLMVEVTIPNNDLKNLKNSLINYISKSFNSELSIYNESQIIKALKNKDNKLNNLTPNGSLIGKNNNF